MGAQPGIFAIGTPEHCFLELDLRDGGHPTQLVATLASLAVDLSTTGGVNLTIGVRPALWTSLAATEHVPSGVEDWTHDLVGPDGFTMPATPHDAWVWLAGGDRTAVFDGGRHVVARVAEHARAASEVTGWLYQHDRDLTGFIDGTENPSVLEAPAAVVVPSGAPGAGSSVLLYQVWPHDSDGWAARPVADQERAIGRTKSDSVELNDLPDDSHVARTVVEVDGEEQDIFRRNVAYGGVTDHGTVFVGFSKQQWLLAEMLRRMAGVTDGVRDALTRYTHPTSGAYYVIPSTDGFVSLTAPDLDAPRTS